MARDRMHDWDEVEEEVERVHHGEVREYRPIDMELLWRCIQCGFLMSRDKELPEQCPQCGAPKTEFESVIED